MNLKKNSINQSLEKFRDCNLTAKRVNSALLARGATKILIFLPQLGFLALFFTILILGFSGWTFL